MAMEQRIYSEKALGAAIKRRRKQLKQTQQEAGAPYNIDQTTVSHIEQDASGTRLSTLLRLLSALDLEMVIRKKKNEPDNESWE